MLNQGGLYRVRFTCQSIRDPTKINALESGLIITFSDQLDRQTAELATNYQVKTWGLKRTRKYGSDHYDIRNLEVTRAELTGDDTKIRLSIPEIEPTWAMEIRYDLLDSDGEKVTGFIQNTIHNLKPDLVETTQGQLIE